MLLEKGPVRTLDAFKQRRASLGGCYGLRLAEGEDLARTVRGFRAEVAALARYARVTPERILASLLPP